MRALAALTFLAGCLSTPPPAAIDARSSDASDAFDAADASSPAACRTEARAPGTAWPPADITVREARVADVDADGVDDLVVLVAPDGAAQAGPSRIYVLYGPVDHAAPQYHAVLDVGATAEIQAWGAALDDVDGDGCLDLTVAGPPIQGRTAGAVAVWRHGRGAAPWQGTPARAGLPSLGVSAPLGPVLPVWADLSSNPARDLVVTQLDRVDLFTAPPTTAAATFSGQEVPAPSGCNGNRWDNINAVVAQPAGGVDGAQRLHVFGHYRQSVIVVRGGAPEVASPCAVSTGLIARAAAFAELTGVAPVDLIVGGGERLGARLLSGQADPVTPMDGALICNSPRIDADDGYNIQGLAAGELDGTTVPEVVVIDYDQTVQTSFACLVNLTAASGAALVQNGTSELPLGAGVVRTVAIGVVGGRGVAWILDVDGRLRCVRQVIGGTALETCP